MRIFKLEAKIIPKTTHHHQYYQQQHDHDKRQNDCGHLKSSHDALYFLIWVCVSKCIECVVTVQ